jgi:tetratricopeptide (TPR) repeat protein
MILDTRFWIVLVVFQVVFGLAIFAITREYYMPDTNNVSAHPPITDRSPAGWNSGISEAEISRLSSPGLNLSSSQDPALISRQADVAFTNKQYDRAAELYEQLLSFSPNDAEIYNNLGLTLQYLGRSNEALRTLNEGVAVDAGHQRIWLTLGYVNSQLGNTEEARTALTNAVQVGSDESIRESARRMLDELP